MNRKVNHNFFFPMVSSLLLLGLFIGYFLKTEYDKEKEAIILETRDNAFVELFTNIREAGPVKWTKDSLGNEMLVKLHSIDSISYTGDIKHLDSVFQEAEASFVREAEVITIDETQDSIKATIQHVRERTPRRLSMKKEGAFEDSYMRIDSNFTFELVDYSGHEARKHPSFLYRQIQINNWLIIKRLYPQILFSMLLFGSVTSAFYLIAMSLRKEKQLSQLRNEFMSNMSHELKTPVSTISVALEALSNFNAADDEKLREEYIDISKSEVKRLGLLVDKALNISLFEQGKFIYDKQDLDLNEEIQHVLKTLKVPLDNQQVALTYEASGSDFVIHADKTHITNVIHNLIENAVKYSEDNPSINIELSSNNESVILSVKDNGKGIAPEYQDKIFDKFFRVPQGDTHNTKGHGLGLSYVRQVILNHDGEIKVKSGAGTGTTFIITFPIRANR